MVKENELWNLPKEPSNTAKKVIEELHKLGRTVRLEGPAQEFRVSRLWLDIAYFFDTMKINYEIDGPLHLDPIRQNSDKRRDAFLKGQGWDIIRISYKRIDKEGPKAIAEWIINDLFQRIFGKKK
ncbi:DUF559 domain-containing protein [Bacillus pacificus]|uniref:DUF559 domain-containing protein n=1 Tax=Bacillus pacificus TaxID=2026187 RepID=UPI003D227E64